MQKASANQRDPQKLTIGISSRALFNLEMENRIFERHGIEPYLRYQVRNEKKVLDPGVAFHLAKTFLSLNKFLSKPLVEVCVLSRNTANSSLRLFNSFDAHHLALGCFGPKKYAVYATNDPISAQPGDLQAVEMPWPSVWCIT